MLLVMHVAWIFATSQGWRQSTQRISRRIENNRLSSVPSAGVPADRGDGFATSADPAKFTQAPTNRFSPCGCSPAFVCNYEVGGGPASVGGGQRGVMSRASSNASETRPVMGAPSSIVSTLGIVPGCSGLRDIDQSPFTIAILWVCPRGESLLPLLQMPLVEFFIVYGLPKISRPMRASRYCTGKMGTGSIRT